MKKTMMNMPRTIKINRILAMQFIFLHGYTEKWEKGWIEENWL